MARKTKKPARKPTRKTKRRTRLGDTPAGHRQKAMDVAYRATRAASDAITYSNSGRCENALDMLVRASIESGAAHAHNAEAGPAPGWNPTVGPPARDAADAARRSAIEAFTRSCLVRTRR